MHLSDVSTSTTHSTGLTSSEHGKLIAHSFFGPSSLKNVIAVVLVAIALGKLHPLRVLLQAIRTRRVTPTSLCMSLVTKSFAMLAATFPSEYLDFIKEMQMVEEPEVLLNGASGELLDLPLELCARTPPPPACTNHPTCAPNLARS